jgi:hypothetical protein
VDLGSGVGEHTDGDMDPTYGGAGGGAVCLAVGGTVALEAEVAGREEVSTSLRGASRAWERSRPMGAMTHVATENSVGPMLQALAPLPCPQLRRRPAARQVGHSPASHSGEPVPRFPRFLLTCN